jgi:membrane protein DedA with SNARE-associated domain
VVSVAWLTDAVVAFVQQYGYVALFVFIALETAWIIHFVPSEIVIPIAALGLVSDPLSFAVFVTIMTVGAVLGSVLAYYLFGRYGDYVLQRYGHVLRVPESELARSKRWFRTHGEGFLLWGRLVPVLRTPISIPAGYAETPMHRFLAYSTVGWGLYNTALVALVYSGADSKSPLDVAIASAEPVWGPMVAFAQASPAVTTLALVLSTGVCVLAWTRREALRGTFS